MGALHTLNGRCHAGKRNEIQPQIERSAEQKQVAKQQFEKLTEAASTLMDSGELDVYSQKKVFAVEHPGAQHTKCCFQGTGSSSLMTSAEAICIHTLQLATVSKYELSCHAWKQRQAGRCTLQMILKREQRRLMQKY